MPCTVHPVDSRRHVRSTIFLPPHREAADVRDHRAPRRRQDHADREAAAVRRRDPARRRGQGARRSPARAQRLDEGRARARHLGDDVGDDVRLRGLHVQPARHAGPRGLQRGHLPHADRGRLGGHGDRRREGHRDPDPQAVRGLPAARRADRDVHQQDGSRGPRSVRAARRDRARPPARGHAGELADRHGPRVPRLLRPVRRSADPDGAHAAASTCRRASRSPGLADPQARQAAARVARSRSCARTSRWCAGCARSSISSRIAPAT